MLQLTAIQESQIESINICKKKLIKQIELFETGISFVDLKSPAVIKKGILKYSKQEKLDLIHFFEQKKNQLTLLKFTPASGAATRMFKFLFDFAAHYSPQKETVNSYLNQTKNQALKLFLLSLEDFPFYKSVKNQILVTDNLTINEFRLNFVQTMLSQKGLNLGDCPKALLPFHKYQNHIASAFEEHLYEAALYAKTNGAADLHFTISKNHQTRFNEELAQIKGLIEKETATKFNITFSYQEESTDTIAVDLNNKPITDDYGKFIFRPGGHGALINNLNAQDADVIFIKNIDNVVTRQYQDEVATYKKLLAGKLLQTQSQSFSYLNELENDNLEDELVHEIVAFAKKQLNSYISPEFDKFSKEHQILHLRDKLNRPIRVCGMVKNENEPGGGPFWVRDTNGHLSLQIIESVQIDPNNNKHQLLKSQATHFNPVDIVCGVKDYKGNKFNLLDFIDNNASFITQKNLKGKKINALEHPGLWNGGMAFWNTIFVEVPLITFNPAKTVNDLLKPTHQTKNKY